MRSVTIGTSVKFETAHRQYGDPSKCGYLHGHNWKADIKITAGKVGPLGYIVDFKDIKKAILEMDHKVLIFHGDPIGEELLKQKQKVFYVDRNPTCENIALLVLDEMIRVCCSVESLLNIEVKIWENDASFGEVSLR